MRSIPAQTDDLTPTRARTIGIPGIEPYPLPTEGDLPSDQVSWSLEARRAALLIHDMQQYFLRPFLEPLRSQLIENVVLVRDRCRALRIPVVYTAQPGRMTVEERGLLADFWGPGMTGDDAHRRIVDQLVPGEGETVFTKWRYSALLRSGLLEYLEADGRDQIIVCGVFGHVGVLATAIDAFSHDIQPFVVADAIADFSAKYHWLTVDYAAQRCAVVITARQLLP